MILAPACPLGGESSLVVLAVSYRKHGGRLATLRTTRPRPFNLCHVAPLNEAPTYRPFLQW
jgi:hypothetical protein